MFLLTISFFAFVVSLPTCCTQRSSRTELADRDRRARRGRLRSLGGPSSGRRKGWARATHAPAHPGIVRPRENGSGARPVASSTVARRMPSAPCRILIGCCCQCVKSSAFELACSFQESQHGWNPEPVAGIRELGWVKESDVGMGERSAKIGHALLPLLVAHHGQSLDLRQVGEVELEVVP